MKNTNKQNIIFLSQQELSPSLENDSKYCCPLVIYNVFKKEWIASMHYYNDREMVKKIAVILNFRIM